MNKNIATTHTSGGGVLFWGIIDTANPFTSITFGNTAAGNDFFGLGALGLARKRWRRKTVA